MASSSSETKGKLFYGWWIVLFCSFLSVYAAGIFYYGFSTFVKPVAAELGWSMTLIAGGFSIYRLEAGIAAPVVGWLLDRIGPAKLVFAGGLVMGGGFIFLSQISTILPFYAAVIIISVGWSGFGGVAMGNPLIGKWFIKKRGAALGIYGAARGLSGLLIPAVAFLIARYGWRTALLILGPLTWLVVLPSSFAFKHSPERCGLLPDGGPAENGVQPHDRQAAKTTSEQEVDFPIQKALLTPAFWILTICLFSHQITQSAIFVHLIPYLIDVGITSESAASAVTFITLTSMAGRYGFGWLGDRLNPKWLLFVLYILQPVGILSLLRVSHILDIIPFVLVYSTAYGGTTVIKAVITGNFYGRKNYGAIYGIIQGISTMGGFLGPLIAGLVYDLKGSYYWAFTSFAFMMGLTALLVLFLKRPVLGK
ncbi:MAG: MFS transporter [Thermodesulfobacteriota bacterium]